MVSAPGSSASSIRGSAGAGPSASAEDVTQPPETLNLSEADELEASNSKDDSDGGKIKALLGILRRMMGVKDLAAIRLSLPANLLEPVPNLEYWHYLDRGDLFSVIGDYEDPLDRMLATIRFAFTKELKFVHGKVCKPYNSILGEHFRCHWIVQPPEVLEDGHIVPRGALATQQPKPLPSARGSISPASVTAPTTPVTSATSSFNGGKQMTPTNSSKRAAAANDTLSPDDANSERPSAQRGQSSLSNATTTSTSTETGGEPSKARKGLSRILGAGRSLKPSSNSVKSFDSSAATSSTGSESAPVASQKPAPPQSDAGIEDDDNDTDDGASDGGSFKTTKSQHAREGSSATHTSPDAVRHVAFLTEQVSHHPPISSFFVECKESGVQLHGVDQLSAKFTGTNVKIFPGSMNQGIFVRLTEKAQCGAPEEEYQITHPTASVNGMLRGSLWVSISSTTSITCRGGKRGDSDDGKRLRTLIEYKDESWVGKAKFALEGAIYEYDGKKEGADTEFSSIREIPAERVLATFDGSWKGQINWKHKGEKESHLLIDLNEMRPLGPKDVRPISSQDEMESRKIWKPVTDAIIGKQFGDATKHKQVIEQTQRDRAAERKKNGTEFTPRFFNSNIDDGRPKLTEAGRAALDDEFSRDQASKSEE